MKNSYPIILTPEVTGYTVFIPDFSINTQGNSLTEAIEMARDAIGLMGIDIEDDREAIPSPSQIAQIKCEVNELISFVDVDFDEYRKRHDERAVRKNVSLPRWLSYEADKAGLNVSAILQSALKKELNIYRRPE